MFFILLILLHAIRNGQSSNNNRLKNVPILLTSYRIPSSCFLRLCSSADLSSFLVLSGLFKPPFTLLWYFLGVQTFRYLEKGFSKHLQVDFFWHNWDSKQQLKDDLRQQNAGFSLQHFPLGSLPHLEGTACLQFEGTLLQQFAGVFLQQ